MTLALFGGEPVIKTPLAKFNTIDQNEVTGAVSVLYDYPLSGYLGGEERGGHWIQKLEDEWAKAYDVKHAIACNSATSGLMAACAATQVGIGSQILTTPFTMSATSAAPMLFGARLMYGDIEQDTFNLMPGPFSLNSVHAAIVTNLFGCPADLYTWRDLARQGGYFLIEDSAQTPFARIGQTGGVFAGTVGDIGVFSFNVHKHLQCGEGGMVVVPTDDFLADAVRRFINHGELAGRDRIGLNLRMAEPIAAIALEQLRKAPQIIAMRCYQAGRLTGIASKYEWIVPPVRRNDCEHVFYVWAAKINKVGIHRDLIVDAIKAEGFPLKSGYVDPLYRLPAFRRFKKFVCPIAEAMHDRLLATFENCAWTLSDENFDQFDTILKKVESNFDQFRQNT